MVLWTKIRNVPIYGVSCVLCPVCIHTIVSIALLGTQGVGETYSMARLLQPPQMFSDQYKSYESGRNVLTKLSLNSRLYICIFT